MRNIEVTKKVESLLDKFKPIAEEVSGVKLSSPKVVFAKKDKCISMTYCPNQININQDYWNDKKLSSPQGLSKFKFDIAHELGHHVSYTINPRIAIAELRLETIDEGFAEYFCLDLLPEGVLSKKVVDAHREWLLKAHSTYGIGYRFFRKVTNSLGKEEAFNVVKNLDTALIKSSFYIHSLGEKMRSIENSVICTNGGEQSR